MWSAFDARHVGDLARGVNGTGGHGEILGTDIPLVASYGPDRTAPTLGDWGWGASVLRPTPEDQFWEGGMRRAWRGGSDSG